MLAGLPLAVEFRNKSWFGDKTRPGTLAFEREHRLAHVVVDEPQGFPSSVPQVWEVTSPELALVRLHGRNAETWAKKGLASAAERFDYLYTPRELEALAPPVTKLATGARRVHRTYSPYGTVHATAGPATWLEQRYAGRQPTGAQAGGGQRKIAGLSTSGSRNAAQLSFETS